jgi:hypothetical protein
MGKSFEFGESLVIERELEIYRERMGSGERCEGC